MMTSDYLTEREKILIADDDRSILSVLKHQLEAKGYEVIEADNGESALSMAISRSPDLIFLDVDMPRMDGLEVLEALKANSIRVPVIIFTGNSSMRIAIRAINMGAYDYLIKPLDMQRISVLTERCLSEKRARQKQESIKDSMSHPDRPFDMIGQSASMLEVYKSIGSISLTPATTNVLILGESGTGKELVARQIHNWSHRSQRPFVALNVTALPDSLLESELFGYEKGAFTGAIHRTSGKFEQAQDGTLFLDEIGDLSPNLQAKLLRVLQERDFYQVGGKKKIKFHGRIIAATHDNLKKKIKQGLFREDLYYRLNVVTIVMPPLRERKSDIPLLARHFVQKYANQLNIEEPVLPRGTLNYLVEYSWPGNVRELENTIIRAMSLSKTVRLIPADIALPEMVETNTISVPILHDDLQEARRLLNERFEKEFLTKRLKESGGRVAIAAKRSGVNRQSFYRLMKKHGLDNNHYR